MKKTMLLVGVLVALSLVALGIAQSDIYDSRGIQNVVTALWSNSANSATVGTSDHEFGDMYLGDGGIIYLGNDQDVTITHDPDDGIDVAGSIDATGAISTTSSIGGLAPISYNNKTTDTLTAAESGTVFAFTADSGAYALVLPTLSASLVGVHYTFVFTAADNDAFVLTTGDITDTTGDMFVGAVLFCAAAAVNTMEQAGSDENTITLDDNVANTGRGPGTYFTVTAVSATEWFVEGRVEGDSDADGTGSAIFSNAD